MRVIATTAMVLSVAGGRLMPREMAHATKGPEKWLAANALPRKPERVMATWMVAKNFEGSRVSLPSRLARRLPSSAIFLSLVSLMESTAISALANMALRAIRMTCKSRRGSASFISTSFQSRQKA